MFRVSEERNAAFWIRYNHGVKTCFLCQEERFRNISSYAVEKHHIFHGTANRRQADEDGMWVYLCREHHRTGDSAVHGKNAECYDEELKKLGQDAFEIEQRKAGKTPEEAREAFRARYGKSYL